MTFESEKTPLNPTRKTFRNNEQGYVATALVFAVSLLVIAALALMSESSKNVTDARSASIKGSASMVILSQVASRLHNRETLIASGDQSLALKNCLRRAGCPSERTAFQVVDSRSDVNEPEFISGKDPADFMYNERGGFCRNRGPNGSGNCVWAAVATFSAAGDEISFHVTVFPRTEGAEGRFRGPGGRGLAISTDPDIGDDVDKRSREFLTAMAPKFKLSSFWALTAIRNTTKCYPGNAVVPTGMTEYTSPVCGIFNLSGASPTYCPLGTVVKTVMPNGEKGCSEPSSSAPAVAMNDPPLTPDLTPPNPACADPNLVKAGTVQVRIKSNEGSRCPWGKGDNRDMSSKRIRARIERSFPIQFPANIEMCSLEAESSGNNKTRYDDQFLLTLNDYVIMFSLDLIDNFKKTPSGRVYDWSKIVNKPSPRESTGAFCADGISPCRLPKTEETGKFQFGIPAAQTQTMFENIRSKDAEFRLIITGDDNDDIDCQLYNDINLEVNYTYVQK